MGKKTLLSATIYLNQAELDLLKTKANQEQLTISNFLRVKLGFDCLSRGRKQKSDLTNEEKIKSTVDSSTLEAKPKKPKEKSTVVSPKINIESKVKKNKSTVEKQNEDNHNSTKALDKELKAQPLFEFLK